MTRARRAPAAAAAVLLAGTVAACGTGDGATTTLDVLAAASLTDVFASLAATFEEEHPGVAVRVDAGPSSGLARRIVEGAPADVFASASTRDMRTVTAAGLAGGPRVFARNAMEVAVPRDNPARITSLSDLARPGVSVALCQSQVPCGVVAREVLTHAGLRVRAVTEETDVRSALTKVRLGEVDAALVYVTDVRAARDDVRGVAVPARLNAATDYLVATVEGADEGTAARQFVDLVLSPQGRRVLGAAGFRLP